MKLTQLFTRRSYAGIANFFKSYATPAAKQISKPSFFGMALLSMMLGMVLVQSSAQAVTTQSISFAPLKNKSSSAASFTVSATASSALPITFSSKTASVCAVSGSTVSLLSPGNCIIAADQSGNASYAAAAEVTQSFAVVAPPTVTLTSPTTNTTYISLANINLSANATANPGASIVTVQFLYNGNNDIGILYNAPYAYTWSGVNSGTFVITVKATDNLGGVSIAGPITATVERSTPPVITLSSPTANQHFTAGSNISLLASATDTIGSISQVQFYNGSTLLGSATQPPYSFSWINVGAGNYSISAKAINTSGFSTTSAPVAISVIGSTLTSQTINFAPLANKTLGAAPFSITASATSSLPVTLASSTPSVCTVSNAIVTLLNTGTCRITADQHGNASYSAAPEVAQSFTVAAAAPGAPVVNVTAPANGQSFAAGSSVTLSAAASSLNGTITDVAFFNNGALVGTVTQPPYSMTLPNVAAGTYSIVAQTTNNAGATSTSAASVITVTASTSAITLSFGLGDAYVAADGVASAGFETGNGIEKFNSTTVITGPGSSTPTYSSSHFALLQSNFLISATPPGTYTGDGSGFARPCYNNATNTGPGPYWYQAPGPINEAGIFSDNVPTQPIYISQVGNTPFNLQQIDLAPLRYYVQGAGYPANPGHVTITGTLANGGTVTQNVVLTELGFASFTLSGFNNVILVHIQNTGGEFAYTPYYQIANIVVEPVSN